MKKRPGLAHFRRKLYINNIVILKCTFGKIMFCELVNYDLDRKIARANSTKY